MLWRRQERNEEQRECVSFLMTTSSFSFKPSPTEDWWSEEEVDAYTCTSLLRDSCHSQRHIP